ncbi:MAG: T9SS type A sorting domain-containing protein [Bacteroidales bacterium]|nr:T9SS type A sorting domain-containing protein [Bacteroidales bacterium]
MKQLKAIFATVAFLLAVNVVNAQTLDSEAVASVTSQAVDEAALTETVEAAQQIKVWPQVSTVKIMVDVQNLQEVEIYNCTGRLVKTQKVDKGQSINIETLIPGAYTVKVGNKLGSFTKQ